MASISSHGHPLKSSGSRTPSGQSKPPFFTLVEPGINSAITRGLFQQVRFLVQFGTEVNERDENRCTPLIHCAMIEDEQWAVGIARMLIEKGATIGLRDKKGLNALHYACIHNRLALVKIYLSAIDFNVNQGDSLGNTALHYAVTVGNTEMVKQLLEILVKYKITVDPVNKKDITPLMQAYKSGNNECAKLLISIGSANENLRNITECKLHPDSMGDCQNLRDKSKDDNEIGRNKTLRFRVVNEFRRPLSGRPQSSRPASRRKSDREEENVDWEECLLSKAKNSDRLYRAASVNELRNRPELVFNINPIQCFVNGTNSHPKVPRTQRNVSSARFSRPGSGQMRIPTSWRCEMNKLYGSFEFQFTKSFVAGVKPLPPEQEPSSEDSASPRPSSAITTESMSGSVSDIASVCSRRSRKGSGSLPSDGRKRRTSMGSQPKKRPQALLTLRTDSETSSETSVSARRKGKDSESSEGGCSRKSSVKTRTSILSALVKMAN